MYMCRWRILSQFSPARRDSYHDTVTSAFTTGRPPSQRLTPPLIIRYFNITLGLYTIVCVQRTICTGVTFFIDETGLVTNEVNVCAFPQPKKSHSSSVNASYYLMPVLNAFMHTFAL